MSKPIISIRNLSKEYRLQGFSAPYLSLRDAFKIGKSLKPKREKFWALKGINYDVQAGESIAIIGNNGAGKSTLLKILSRITPPTTGEILCRGRVASLLEVGTGFHLELTGRENIFLNGSILGLTKKEIKNQFDAIVDFSGTEKFLDTPLKHFSSGMQLRLAFAVAAHLEPEILVIDEVLAVGDHEFQQKCLGKMRDVANEGRTIIFVSHNLNALQTLCTRGIVLSQGEIVQEGPIGELVSYYVSQNQELKEQYKFKGIINEISLNNGNGDWSKGLNHGGSLEIKVKFNVKTPISYPVLGVVVKDDKGSPIIGINNRHYLTNNMATDLIAEGVISAKIEDLKLIPGNYKLDLYLGDRNVDIDKIENEVHFKINEKPITPTGYDLNKSLNKVFFDSVSWTLEEF